MFSLLSDGLESEAKSKMKIVAQPIPRYIAFFSGEGEGVKV